MNKLVDTQASPGVATPQLRDTGALGEGEGPAAFKEHFTLEHHRGLCVLAPPPCLTWVREEYPRLQACLWSLDREVSGWPLIRSMGDHFLIIMKKR